MSNAVAEDDPHIVFGVSGQGIYQSILFLQGF